LNSTELKCTQNTKLYHFVRTILSNTILSIPFCPYHFVRTILSGHPMKLLKISQTSHTQVGRSPKEIWQGTFLIWGFPLNFVIFYAFQALKTAKDSFCGLNPEKNLKYAHVHTINWCSQSKRQPNFL